MNHYNQAPKEIASQVIESVCILFWQMEGSQDKMKETKWTPEVDFNLLNLTHWPGWAESIYSLCYRLEQDRL